MSQGKKTTEQYLLLLRHKILNKIFTNEIQQHIKELYTTSKWNLFQEGKNSSTIRAINVMCYIKRAKDKRKKRSSQLMLKKCENMWQNQTPFIINTFGNLGTEERFLSKINDIFQKPTAGIILYCEKLKIILLHQEQDKGV